jgi:peptidoglycan hydrolase FlgJ
MDDMLSELGLLQARNAGQQQLERNLKQLSGTPGAKRNPEAEKQGLMEACKGFETLFLAKLWQQMRSTLPKEGMLHNPQEESYISMFDQEVASSLAQGKGVGIARMMFEQLSERLDAASASTSGSPKPQASDRISPLDRSREKHDPSALEAGIQPVQTEVAEAVNTAEMSVRERVEVLAREIERTLGKDGGRNQKILRTSAVDSGRPGAIHLSWPMEGEISSGFGWRTDPFTGEKAWHPGIDLVAEIGAPVRACWPGEVSFVGDWGGYGQAVVVEHDNGWTSIYAHNSRNLVEVGQKVRAGEEIANLGNSGRSTGPHLHFEIRQGEIAWDPLQIRQRLMAGLSIGRQA